MLGTTTAILLCLLPSQVNGLTAAAKCLSGFQWMFSSIGQSPCDVAVELASVCITTPYQLVPIGAGWFYLGPYVGYDTSCLCSSVYYSLLSACAFCQGADILPWTTYNKNCTVVHHGVYTQQIPVGVRVPAYAYQDVSVYDQFNITVAFSTRGVESSRFLPSSTQISISASSSSSSATTTTAIGASAPANSTAMIAGIVVGGLVSIGLIVALITFLVLRSKQKSQAQNNSRFQRSPDMALTPDTTVSLIHPGMVSNANDQNIYTPDMDNPHGPYSDPNLNSPTYASPQPWKQHTGMHYSAAPEFLKRIGV